MSPVLTATPRQGEWECCFGPDLASQLKDDCCPKDYSATTEAMLAALHPLDKASICHKNIKKLLLCSTSLSLFYFYLESYPHLSLPSAPSKKCTPTHANVLPLQCRQDWHIEETHNIKLPKVYKQVIFQATRPCKRQNLSWKPTECPKNMLIPMTCN